MKMRINIGKLASQDRFHLLDENERADRGKAVSKYAGQLKREVCDYLEMHGYSPVSRDPLNLFFGYSNGPGNHVFVDARNSGAKDGSTFLEIIGKKEILSEVLRHMVDDHRFRQEEGFIEGDPLGGKDENRPASA